MISEITPVILEIVFGLVAGSFLNVCIYRLPQQSGFFKSRSYCPHCKKQILWRHNIPLLSYIFLQGRCACCRGNISIRYPLVEMMAALFTVCVFQKWGLSATALFYIVMIYLLIVISFIDLEHMFIPDRLIWLGAGVTFFMMVCGQVNLSWQEALTGAAFYGSALGLAGLLGKLLFRQEAMGWGDVKLAIVLGLLLGWQMSVMAMICAFLLAAAVVVTGLALGKIQRRQLIPFGPFMALGAVTALFWGDWILKTYLNLFNL